MVHRYLLICSVLFGSVACFSMAAAQQVSPTESSQAAAPEVLLTTAMKKMSSGTWEVKGTASFKKTIKLRGLLAGKDFDLTMEPGSKPGFPLRGIVIGDKAWVCSDGKTWRTGSTEDRMLYNLTHTPISPGRDQPPFEEVGREQRKGATWLHIRLKVPKEEKVDSKSLPQYWLVLDAEGAPLYIRRTEMPMVTRGSSDVTLCSFDYTPTTKRITPPNGSTKEKQHALEAPIDDETHGFNEIEANKFKWAGKVVRVSLSAKLLQCEELGAGVYRAMLKDTAAPMPAYGLVEFPNGGLVELGFLKKTVSGAHNWSKLEELGALGRTEGDPVSLYVQVVPIGQKPAARSIAVGSKMVRGADGAVSYSW